MEKKRNNSKSSWRIRNIVTIVFLSFFMISNVVGEDLKIIINLVGYWKFKIGDDMAYSKYEYNDKDWDKVYVPKSWEENGYYAYDGFAWYRKSFELQDQSNYNNLFLYIGNIDDVDEIFLNGKKIGGTGFFPPEYITAYGYVRNYYIPKEYIKEGKNIISIRVFDGEGPGGIVSSAVKICTDEDADYLTVDLSGEWKFHLHDNKQWKEPDYNDNSWETLYAPMYWDAQGYFNFDGYAWYRKRFKVPSSLLQEDELYLILGKIDDTDKVYINGEYVGSVYDLRNKSYYSKIRGEYYTRRIYEIPEGLLKTGENIIAIKVYDGQIGGGIYEGPLGILTEKNYERIISKYRYEKPAWEEFLELFVY